MVFFFSGTPEPYRGLPTAQWEGPGRWNTQRRRDPEPVGCQLWLWRGPARAVKAQREAGTSTVAGGGAAGRCPARHTHSRGHEEAHRPGSGSGTSSVCGKSHGTPAGAAHSVWALGGQGQQPAEGQVGAALTDHWCLSITLEEEKRKNNQRPRAPPQMLLLWLWSKKK